MVAVHLREILSHLTLPEGVVECVVDQLGRDAIARSLVPVDGQGQSRAGGLLVGRDVPQFGQRLHLFEQPRRPGVEFVEVWILQRILKFRARRAAADADVLCGLKKEGGTLHLTELRTQSRNDLLGRGGPLVARLQCDEDASVVQRAGSSECHRDGVNGRILLGDRSEFLGLALHLLERDVLGTLRGADDQARILAREEAFGDDREEIDGDAEGREKHQQRGEAPADAEVETALVPMQHPVEDPLAQHVETTVLGVLVVLHEPGRHHGGQGQGDEGRHHDGHGQGDREFAEQAADDAAHQQQGNQHRDERDRDRQDGEADFAGTLHGGIDGLHALLEVPLDVLQHHDRIVDHEAHRYGEGHERKVVQAVARHPHQRDGAEQG